MLMRGGIHSEEAYALGKMLDHSAWSDLPRKITPSDLDMAFDNDGKIIFGELSSSECEWQRLSRGQRLLYENAIKNSPHCAVLCKHAVSLADGRPIDTRGDITSFQVMLYDYGLVICPVFDGNDRWQKFILRWLDRDGWQIIRRRLLSLYGLPKDQIPKDASEAIRTGRQFEYVTSVAA